MVFGFFTRKQQEIEAGPSNKFQFPQRQLHTPASSLSFPVHPPPGPDDTPTPPPDTIHDHPESVTDSTQLHSLIVSVPPQTLHAYTLAHLSPIPPSPFPLALTSTPSLILGKPIEPPSPHTLTTLTRFFSSLTPPPKLHCVRCHTPYFELENNDRSCHIPHDDDSATVGRVRTGNGGTSEYETLFGCCGKTVEGDGDMGPPDGWCYEGLHTTDPRRARFRADSTPQDDKLIPCSSLRCGQPPLPPRSSRSRGNISRKRSRPIIEVDEDTANENETDDDLHSVASSTQSLGHKKSHSKSTSITKIVNANHRRSISNASSGLSQGQTKARKRKMEEEEESTDAEPQQKVNAEAGPSTVKPKTKRRPRKITSPAEVHSEDEETNDESIAANEPKRPTKRTRARKVSILDPSPMDVDEEPQIQTSPKSPKRNSKNLSGPALATSNTKPLQSSPLTASFVLENSGPMSPQLIQRPESPTPLNSKALERKTSTRKLEVAVEIVSRADSPNKGMGSPSTFKGSRVKDKVKEIEKGNEKTGDIVTVKRKGSSRSKKLGEVIATSVDGETSGVWS